MAAAAVAAETEDTVCIARNILRILKQPQIPKSAAETAEMQETEAMAETEEPAATAATEILNCCTQSIQKTVPTAAWAVTAAWAASAATGETAATANAVNPASEVMAAKADMVSMPTVTEFMRPTVKTAPTARSFEEKPAPKRSRFFYADSTRSNPLLKVLKCAKIFGGKHFVEKRSRFL